MAGQMSELADKIGHPSQIIQDGGSDLLSATNILLKSHPEIHKTGDISHFIANLMKKKYSKMPAFIELPGQLQKLRSRLQQTSLAHLVPPGFRSKARFMTLSKIAKWFEEVWRSWDQAKDVDPELWEDTLVPMRERLSFYRHFAHQVLVLNKIQKVIKNEGLNPVSFAESIALADELAMDLRNPLVNYLKTELEFATIRGVWSAGI